MSGAVSAGSAGSGPWLSNFYADLLVPYRYRSDFLDPAHRYFRLSVLRLWA